MGCSRLDKTDGMPSDPRYPWRPPYSDGALRPHDTCGDFAPRASRGCEQELPSLLGGAYPLLDGRGELAFALERQLVARRRGALTGEVLA